MNLKVIDKSISQKRREKKQAVNVILGKNIKAFAILTAENPDSQPTSKTLNKKYNKQLRSALDASHLVYCPVEGRFAGNVELSYFVFNPTINEIKYFAGKAEQTSFFYGYPNDGKLIMQYWVKQDTDKPYNKVSNPYILSKEFEDVEFPENPDEYSIIGDLKFRFPAHVFDSFNEQVDKNLKKYKIKDVLFDVINWATYGQKLNLYKDIKL